MCLNSSNQEMLAQLKALPPVRPSGLALAAFFCGIVAIPLWMFVNRPAPLFGVLAVVLGLLALRVIRRNPGRVEGKGVAVLAIILGWLKLLAVLFVLVTGANKSAEFTPV
jgi:hypothetical protein